MLPPPTDRGSAGLPTEEEVRHAPENPSTTGQLHALNAGLLGV
jgi:hypothetical protein